jgi:hypothetical protein
MKFSERDAIRIVSQCIKEYDDKLCGKKHLIIFRNHNKNFEYLEIAYHSRNFQHLTGLFLTDPSGNIITKQSENFYRKFMAGTVSPSEIQFRADGTAALKLQALPVLMDITRISKITGNYNFSKPLLIAEKVVGGVNFCLGIDKDSDGSGEYVPCSAMIQDIRDIVDESFQIIAILQKDQSESKYTKIRHVAKGLCFENIITSLPPEILKIILIP